MFNTKDPYLLLSIINTKLRDEADTLEELCKIYNTDQEALTFRLEAIGYRYNAETNQFTAV